MSGVIFPFSVMPGLTRHPASSSLLSKATGPRLKAGVTKGVVMRGEDERVLDVRFDEASLIVDLMDGRTIAAPLAWYPRLLRATAAQRAVWEKAGAGYGIHWPEIDEDLSVEGLLCGAPAPKAA